MERTKEPTRDYPSLSRTPWTFWETLYARRSHRKYLPVDAEADPVAGLREILRLALAARGAGEENLIPVTDARLVEEIKRRAHKGAPNKINLWLTRAPLLGFLVLAVSAEDVGRRRPRELPRAAMAAEDCVLWLTERGMGTCWLGGVNQEEVRKALGLIEDTVIPAVISFGRPKPRVRASDFDHLVYRTISRRRKPLSAVARWQNMEQAYSLAEPCGKRFSASAIQDVEGLLRNLTDRDESRGDVPLRLALEACLEAARIAPSAGNAQRWCFVVVSEEEGLDALSSACGTEGQWRGAVAGLGHPGGWEATFFEKPFWMVDLPIALSHLSLMAASMDLAVDLCLEGMDERRINRLLKIPGGLRLVGVMGIR